MKELVRKFSSRMVASSFLAKKILFVFVFGRDLEMETPL